MTTQTLDLYNIERKVFWALVALLCGFVMFYLYSVSALSFAVVERNTMNQKAHELANTAGRLEGEYLSQTNAITLAYAQKLGFEEVNAKFAGDTGVKLSLAR